MHTERPGGVTVGFSFQAVERVWSPVMQPQVRALSVEK
ncbi:uncharacterized protein CTRU02_203680 [Colletotrichum truncatum]|uniref:Uncharacterized protein n=1 Tax=Colletotrichum truncatum TaxID=5467 RepID=A0ACC3ZA03_COLTU|nr:uncharacterized protein CTRU02_04012 [Colletotrichum truncatum]KAF6796052.1 hypothetical protein CTRU02_04012 [Colletotrichum truncatum]